MPSRGTIQNRSWTTRIRIHRDGSCLELGWSVRFFMFERYKRSWFSKFFLFVLSHKEISFSRYISGLYRSQVNLRFQRNLLAINPVLYQNLLKSVIYNVCWILNLKWTRWEMMRQEGGEDSGWQAFASRLQKDLPHGISGYKLPVPNILLSYSTLHSYT